MRVLIATPLYPPEPGGPATYAKILKEGLPSAGADVAIVKFGSVKWLPSGIRHVAFFLKVLRAAASCDVVYALDAMSVGVPAMCAAWFWDKPFVVKIVGDYAWEQGKQQFGITESLDRFVKEKNLPPKLKRFQWLQNKVATFSNVVIVPSEYLKGIVHAWGIPEQKVRVIYNSVSHNDILNLGQIPAELLELPHPLIVTAGRLVPWKHIDGVIEAVRTLRIEGGVASLAIIGDGPDEEKLQEAAERLLPGKNYSFTGARTHDEVLAALAAADVFVLNSSYEGLSHLLIEAALLGTPVIATNVGGNPEVIVNEKNGLLVPVADNRSLVNAIKRILKDSELRAEIAANKQKIVEKFSDHGMLYKLVLVFTEVI